MKKLNRKFFDRKTTTVARELLGKYLVRKIGPSTSSGQAEIIKARIIETEAYCGPKDLACHASKGRTKRTEIMFGPPGHAYVYLIYGMYHCLNIVTEKEGYPAAVLIRGTELKTKNYKLKTNIDGPGKLCRELKIDRSLNGTDVCDGKKIWIEDRGGRPQAVHRSKRIGVDYAGEWKDKLWRFYID